MSIGDAYLRVVVPVQAAADVAVTLPIRIMRTVLCPAAATATATIKDGAAGVEVGSLQAGANQSQTEIDFGDGVVMSSSLNVVVAGAGAKLYIYYKPA